MSTVGWALLIAVTWTGAAVLVAVALGRMIRRRDREVEAEVRVAMDGLDDELAQLFGGRS